VAETDLQGTKLVGGSPTVMPLLEDPSTVPWLRIGALLADIPHALIGGHAVNVWVEPRLTIDVDLTLSPDRMDLERVESRLVADGLVKTDEHASDPGLGPDFQRFKSTDGRLIVELQVARTEFQREVIRRAHRLSSGLSIATPEDLIVLKLIANRTKDFKDLIDLCALPDLDWGHIDHWASVWDVRERIAQFRKT